MRKLLNTLYVTSEEAWLRKDGANVVVEINNAERGRAPLHLLDGIVCFNRTGCSPGLMAACAEAGIALSFLDPNGRFLARVEGTRSGNVLLRRSQHRFADNASAATDIVRSIVTAKIANQRVVIQRTLRDHGERLTSEEFNCLTGAAQKLATTAEKALAEKSIADLRGREGEAASLYFGVFDNLVRVEKDSFRFSLRSRRPPLDRINALLSFLYALLGHDCRSALEAHGLDPQIGFLHADKPGRAGLALDLMEEFRPVMADRLALSLVNRGQLQPDDFLIEEAGAVRLSDDARKRVLIAYQDRKREELRHPFFDEKAPLGLFPNLQAQALARRLRGDIDGYPAFIWK